MSIAKQFRITREKDFDRVMKEGRYVRDRAIALKFNRTPHSFNRFAVLVGKKISPRAVVRNQLKRRIKESLRKHLPDMKKGYDVILFPRPELFNHTFRSGEQSVALILKKAGLL